MFKIRKIHRDNAGMATARKQREVSISNRCSTSTYGLLFVGPMNTVRSVSPSPLRRMPRETSLQVPAMGRGQSRSRSASPSFQFMSNYIYKVIDWLSDSGLEELSDCYSIVLREYSTAPEGNSPAEGKLSSASSTQDAADEQVFLLYSGRDGEQARDAFVRTLTSLKLFLCGVRSPLHEEFLKDIFHHHLHGPVALEDFPELVAKWNQAGPGSRVVIDVNAQYEDGLTALHLACDGGQEEVVQQLLQLGADSSVVDSEGNTAYHLAVTSGKEKCLKALLDMDSQLRGSEHLVKLLSVQNNDDHTPLMLAASSNQVQAALQLLSADADVNVTSRETGDSALHIAARKGYLILTRLLSAFDASLDIRNKSNETPLEAAEASTESGALECCESLGALVEVIQSAEEVPVADYPVDGPVLLSLDGGGIRGLLELMLLHKLESILIDMDPTFKSLLDYFDLIIGSSTGSIVALGLVYQNLQPRNIYCKYFEVIAAMLKYRRPIPDEGYNQVIKKVFPETTVFTDVTTPKVAITTTLADRTPPEVHLMCNYGEARQGQKGPSERKVWEAVRAATAGPTYVEAFENKLIDGGIMANNPTLIGMTEIVQLCKAEGKPPKIGMVLSLSTGVIYSRTVESVNIKGRMSSVLQDLKSAASVVQVFMMRLIARDGPVVEQASAWCEMIGCPFFRLSPPIAEVDSFEGDTAKIVEMMFFGLIYIKRIEERIKSIAQLLIKHRNQKLSNE